MIPGLSYGCVTGSLAYPKRWAERPPRARQDMLMVVLDLVHVGNLGPLPPSPSCLANKGELIGVAKYSEFFR